MTQEQDIVERAAFEKWLMDVHGLDSVWNEERNCFDDFPAHLAFKAWQAASSEAAQTIAALRAEYGKLKEHFDTACYRAEAAEAERDEALERIELLSNLPRGGISRVQLVALRDRAEAAEARVEELEEALAYDAMMADQLCTALERREERIKELERLYGIARNYCEDWHVQATTAVRERDEARKALEPFIHYEPWMDEWQDHQQVSSVTRHTFGDLRRARAALSSNREAGE